MSTNYNPVTARISHKNKNQNFYNKMWEKLKPSCYDNTFSISVLIYEKTERNENSSDEFKNIYNEEVPKVYKQWSKSWTEELTTKEQVATNCERYYKTKMAEKLCNWSQSKGEILDFDLIDKWLNSPYNRGTNYDRDYFKISNYLIHHPYSAGGYIEIYRNI